MPPDTSIEVLYVTGYERSGTTILLNLLGETDGFFAAGELRNLWPRILVEDKPCGCGESLRDCPLWQQIFDRAFGGWQNVDAEAVLRQRRWVRTRWAPLFLLPGTGRLLARRLDEFLPATVKLYTAIAEVTGCRVIVDSSKAPVYGRALDLAPELRTWALHVVRDPRAVEYSCRKRKKAGHPGYRRHTAVGGAARWMAQNLFCERLSPRLDGRYLRVSYEDVLAEPGRFVARTLSWLGQETPDRIPGADGVLHMKETHTVGGSPSRFRTGAVPLVTDEAWRRHLDPGTTNTTAWLTRPLTGRYGYRDAA